MQTIFLVSAIVIIDQITKFAVRALMVEGQTIDIINGFLSLTYYNNTGVAFSFLSGHRMAVTFLQVVTMSVVLIFHLATRGKRKLFDFALALILAGGIGNIIDRLIFGQVTDMISFSIFPPVFNVADIAVTLGCGLLIIDIIREIAEDR